MTELFQNKYRVPSTRLTGWDYASPGPYFVTICTHNRIGWFGEIRNAQMIFSEIGKIVFDEWIKTPTIRQNVELDAFVVMPNHFHGIIILKNIDDHANVETTRRVVSTKTLPAGSLGAVIAQFKSICTKRIRKMYNPDFRWQSRFYDRIIRDEPELYRIREYIRNNPARWQDDRYYQG